MNSFGEYVRGLRKSSRLTLKQAEALGVASNAYLSQLERGNRKRPHPDILKRMAKAYNEPVKNLLIAAGYLAPEMQDKPTEAERVESAFEQVQNDPHISQGTRRRNLKLSLASKRYIVKMYEDLTGRKLL